MKNMLSLCVVFVVCTVLIPAIHIEVIRAIMAGIARGVVTGEVDMAGDTRTGDVMVTIDHTMGASVLVLEVVEVDLV